jgi:membrane protease YdiL (CAAX protease family)
LLSTKAQSELRRYIDSKASVLAAAIVLATLFCAAAAWYGALSWQLSAIVCTYLLVPVACAVVAGTPATDFLAIIALWLPLEFAVGATFVPRPVQGTLHAIAYGVAISLALILFLIYRRLEGMKYIPARLSDLLYAAVGFLCAFAILIPIGLAIGFLDEPHAPAMSLTTAVVRVGLIFAGTALPEEILFRSLIQNWLMQRLGASNLAITLASVIFGLAHLNNAPGRSLNWRYAIVATLAGFIFGKVFQRSASVLASALVHTGVNAVKHLFF